MRHLILLFFGFSILLSCSRDETIVERGIYYWESSSSSFSDKELDLVNSNRIAKIYLKLFEITFDDELGALPISKTKIKIPSDFDSVNVVPCVYIQNNVFLKMEKHELEDFAENTLYLINKMLEDHLNILIKTNEIQIDCDWTISSKENYFQFLKLLASKTNSKLSCTLRMYPYKYHEKMGVPPVDRAMLMCYNLLSPKNNDSKNSIFDLNEFKKYTDKKVYYPIPLDVALPKYSWNICYENKTFKGVIHGPQKSLQPYLKRMNSLWSVLQKDTVINDVYLRKGYRIKTETVSQKTLKRLIAQLKKNSSFNDTITVSFFQLDEEEFYNTSHEELDHLFCLFSK